MTYIQAVDLKRRRVLLSSGAVLEIAFMVDEDGRQTDVLADVTAVTILGGDLNLYIPALNLSWPAIQ